MTSETRAATPFEVVPGRRVEFEHGDVTLSGVVNGDPFVMFKGWHDAQAYVPVHVYDGNQNLMVHIGNLVSMEQ